jgi:hypothetical protein
VINVSVTRFLFFAVHYTDRILVLNALMSNARIAMQLSTREGFEVKVSEAIHAGIPIIACTSPIRIAFL